MKSDELNRLSVLSKNIRLHTLRMTNLGGSSHVGSGLSMADLLSVLYGAPVLRYRNSEPKWPGRDFFILSKGHGGAAVYATLAEVGFFSTSKLSYHYKNGSEFSGHISHKGVPGVEFSTGSLGHGLGVGVGIAKGIKLRSRCQRVFVLLSDGECDEGSNWEAILFASHHKLNNLIAIIDYNKIQSLDHVANTLGLEPFADKWRAFGWNVYECNGHDLEEIYKTLCQCTASENLPSVIIAHTVKGKGVSFMEGKVLWHYRTAKGDEFNQAIEELEGDK